MSSTVRRLLCSLVVPVLALAACSDVTQPTAAPATSVAAATRQGERAPDLERLARFKTKPSVTVAWAKKWIGPEGGRLEFQGFAIDVPAGAVSKVTQFSLRLPVDPKGSQHVVAEFAPHNVPFARPVTIEFPLAGTSIEGQAESTVLWWNPEAGWVDIGAAATADGRTLRAQTGHFSLYGSGLRYGGTVIATGG